MLAFNYRLGLLGFLALPELEQKTGATGGANGAPLPQTAAAPGRQLAGAAASN